MDPTTKQPFTNNQIPKSLFNQSAVKLATKYLPATADPCGKIQYGIRTTGDEDQVIGRMDWVHNE